MNVLFLDYWLIFLIFLFASFLSFIIILASFLLVEQKPDTEKLLAYESGFDPFADSRSIFEVRFFLVGILFILFDGVCQFIKISNSTSSSFVFLFGKDEKKYVANKWCEFYMFCFAVFLFLFLSMVILWQIIGLYRARIGLNEYAIKKLYSLERERRTKQNDWCLHSWK